MLFILFLHLIRVVWWFQYLLHSPCHMLVNIHKRPLRSSFVYAFTFARSYACSLVHHRRHRHRCVYIAVFVYIGIPSIFISLQFKSRHQWMLIAVMFLMTMLLPYWTYISCTRTDHAVYVTSNYRTEYDSRIRCMISMFHCIDSQRVYDFQCFFFNTSFSKIIVTFYLKKMILNEIVFAHKFLLMKQIHFHCISSFKLSTSAICFTIEFSVALNLV